MEQKLKPQKSHLTHQLIVKLKGVAASTGERQEYIDPHHEGVRLRVSPKGKVSWSLACRDQYGKMRRYPLGTYPTITIAKAREEARSLRDKVKRDGFDPIAEKRKRRTGTDLPRNLVAIIDIYEEKVGKKKRSWMEARRRIESVFKGILSDPIETVSKPDLQIIADNHKAVMSASAAVRYLRPILKWGADRDYVSETLSKIKPPEKVVKRDRVLKKEELKAILRQITMSEKQNLKVMHFILLTLARLKEAAKAKWCEIDFETQVWTIPKTKNGKSHSIPLSSQAVELLQRNRRHGMKPSDYIFPSKTGNVLSNWDRSTKALFRLTQTSGWHRHDLRRTSASLMGDLSVPPYVIESALNHAYVHSQLASNYNNSRYPEDVKAAFQVLGSMIETITKEAVGNPMAGGR
jgi:integrase